MYVWFENPGTLDMRSVTVLGVNDKPNTNSPIGYFGTGFKYALAVCARYGLKVTIQDGTGEVWHLGVKHDKFRSKEFAFVVLVNGNRVLELPFTTELGKNWRLWTVIRELECNARDEGGGIQRDEIYPQITKNVVRIIVEGEVNDRPFASFIDETRATLFFEMTPGEAKELPNTWEYKPTPTSFVYYRGIKVYQIKSGKQFANTYNFLQTMDLTEDRTLKDTYTMGTRLEKFLMRECPTEALARVLNNSEAAEWDACPFSWLSADDWAPAHREMVMRAYSDGRYMNERLKNHCRDAKIASDAKKARKIVGDERDMFDDALDLLKFGGYDIEKHEDIDIIFVGQLPGNALGMAEERKMYIAAANFTNGLECLACTLLEEFIHITEGHKDETRDLQDHLLREIIVQIKSHRRYFNRRSLAQEDKDDTANTARSTRGRRKTT